MSVNHKKTSVVDKLEEENMQIEAFPGNLIQDYAQLIFILFREELLARNSVQIQVMSANGLRLTISMFCEKTVVLTRL